MTSREFQERLARRARRAGLSLPADLSTRLEAYYRLLATWNQKINLTALNLADPPPDALDRLLVEPVLAARHASAAVRRMIDIGSGGGSPAIPCALALPRVALLMVESKTRKSVFLREALRAVELSDSDVATSRYEELLARPDLHEAHELLTIRAVRVETRVLTALQAFVRPSGHLFLFRGAVTADASERVMPPLKWSATYPLVDGDHSRLVVLAKRGVAPSPAL